jgi:hypothetical protein
MERGLLPMRPEPCHHDSPVLRGTRDLRHRSYIPLVALQNDPPNCQDLIAGQELVPIGLGQRLLDIAVGSATYLHCDMGRHDTALDRDEEPFLAVFEQITVFQHRGAETAARY